MGRPIGGKKLKFSDIRTSLNLNSDEKSWAWMEKSSIAVQNQDSFWNEWCFRMIIHVFGIINLCAPIDSLAFDYLHFKLYSIFFKLPEKSVKNF